MVCQATFLETAKALNWPVGSMPGVSTNLGVNLVPADTLQKQGPVMH